MKIRQYGLYWIDLNPTRGTEINKVRPCLVISPNEMNDHLQTVIIAPLTNRGRHGYPSRIRVNAAGITGWIVLDQIRAIDRARITKYAGLLEAETIVDVKAVLQIMLVDP